MNELLNKLKEQFLAITSKMSKSQKIIAGVSIISVIIFSLIFSMMSSKISYVPLFTDLSEKDAAIIKTQLDKKGIKYNLTKNGTTIEVDEKNKYNIRLDLANSNALPKNGVGWEIFDNVKIGTTEKEKEIMLIRAISGELERTISSMKQVKKAKVTITPSNNDPFADTKTLAKASVMLELQPMEKLNEENVLAVMRLVASSIDGLGAENVEVMDTEGNLLSDSIEQESASGMSNKKLDMQKKIEKELEQKAKGVLAFLGSGNYSVKVGIELDFDKEIMNKESYTTPTVNGEQLPTGLVRSEQNGSESYTGSKNVAEGVPGTASNVPGYVGANNSNGNSQYVKNNTIKNYEINSQKESFEKSLGKIRKISISVVLNKDSDYFKKNQFSDIEKRDFENIVKNAVGYDDKRGDSINVSAKPFDRRPQEEYAKAKKEDMNSKLYMIIGSVILVILIIAGIAISIFLKNLEEKKMREREKEAIRELIPDIEQITLGEQFSVEEQERKEKEQMLKDVVKNKPEDVANLIRTWMMED